MDTTEDRRSKSISLRLAIAFGFASVFSAWASYLIHIVPLEQGVLPILDAILRFEGRAPDQYRILPYLFIKGINFLLNDFVHLELSLRYAVLFFDSTFIFLSALAITHFFDTKSGKVIPWILFLVFPYLMFDGYKPISSFILFLSILAVVLLKAIYCGRNEKYPGLMVLIFLLAFTRADVAFIFSVALIGCTSISTLKKLLALSMPIGIQLLLSKIIFPESAYFTHLIMIGDNLSLQYLFYSPPTFLFIGCCIFFWRNIYSFLKSNAIKYPWVIVAMIGYVLTLFVIARPNEYRLFLPLLPLVMWLSKESISTTENRTVQQ